ncbi:MAG: hypothetical protein H7844_02660 [Nitrospirae bacterium YQR-1]
MNIEENVKKVVEEHKSKLDQNPEFNKAKNFYDEMNRLGLIKKQEYDIAPVDTIGRKYYYETINVRK